MRSPKSLAAFAAFPSPVALAAVAVVVLGRPELMSHVPVASISAPPAATSSLETTHEAQAPDEHAGARLPFVLVEAAKSGNADAYLALAEMSRNGVTSAADLLADLLADLGVAPSDHVR